MTTAEITRMIIRTAGKALSSTQHLVLLHLIDRADKEWICFPSQQLLAIQTGLTDRTVRTAIKGLVDSGCLTLVGRCKSNEYRLEVETILALGKTGKSTQDVSKEPESISCCDEDNRKIIPHIDEENNSYSDEENRKIFPENRKLFPDNRKSFPVEAETISYEEEQEENQEEKQEEDNVGQADKNALPDQVIDYLNQAAGKGFRHTDSNRKFIRARSSEGFKFEDFQKVIDIKSREWKNNPKMDPYLRPSTLFNSEKFEGYLNQGNQIPNAGGYDCNDTSWGDDLSVVM
jgi:uncharacterized phage protein (TIGR02220 family)